MVHFSASPKNEPHSPFLRERNLFTSRKPSRGRVVNSYLLFITILNILTFIFSRQ
ncbi:MAG: hypothetical protein U5L45_25740 [Saprospiraceae bacterium]|nr:hypothetical protein [Saprospiraceae bacterium]